MDAIKWNSNYVREAFEKMGFWVLGDYDSPVLPVILESGPMMYYMSRLCLE